MKKRVLPLLITSSILVTSTFTGCGIFRHDKTNDELYISTNNSSELISGQYYIWHDENQSNLENDVGVDVSKFKDYDYDIFKPVYQENAPNNSLSVGDSYRVSLMLAENDDRIPTYYEGDELIYYSNEKIPTKFSLERYYDHGYSFGIFGLAEYIAGSGNYALNTKHASKIGYKVGSSAEILGQAISSDGIVISIPYVGDKALTSEDISTAGTIKGLLLNSEYNVDAYIGTERHEIKLTVDTRIFSSYEVELNLKQYQFVGANIIKISLPKYLKSGYYNINGVGLFRYVAEGDSYDSTTNFNDPIIEKDEDGKVIYNPIPVEDYATPEYTNDDEINDNGNVTSIKKSVNIYENDIVSMKIKFTTSESVKTSAVEINYYQVSTADGDKSILESTMKGTKNNPYVIEATMDEIKSGEINRTIEGLDKGSWVFEITGVENYLTHSEEIIALDNEEVTE